jgi:integrase/recombinase XerD
VIVTKHTATAAASRPSLNRKSVTPHTLRHTNAMLLRAKRVDIATIALWLGHESTQSTHIYEHADPALKEQAIARTAHSGPSPADTDHPTHSSRSWKRSDYVERITRLNRAEQGKRRASSGPST